MNIIKRFILMRKWKNTRLDASGLAGSIVDKKHTIYHTNKIKEIKLRQKAIIRLLARYGYSPRKIRHLKKSMGETLALY